MGLVMMHSIDGGEASYHTSYICIGTGRGFVENRGPTLAKFVQMKLFVCPLICIVEFYLGRYQSVFAFIKHITTV